MNIERERIDHAGRALRDHATVLKEQRDIQRDLETTIEQLEQENQDLRDWVAAFNQQHSLQDAVRSWRPSALQALSLGSCCSAAAAVCSFS